MPKDESSNQRDSSMSWWLWEIIILAGVALLAVLAITARELPSIRRYLRMKSM